MTLDRDREFEALKVPMDTDTQLETFKRQAMADPPFRGELTTIWATEKAELFRRIEALEVSVQTLERLLTKAAPSPTA